MSIFTKMFWRSAVGRAIHTVAQTVIATIGTSAVIAEVDWQLAGSAAVLAGVLSVLKSVVVGTPEGGAGVATNHNSTIGAGK